jgi:anti-sigma factor RsiW
MTLDSIEPDQAEIVALLQPFVDGELSDDERELVAGQIALNPDFQAIVREQQQVRAALRELERELAPAGLRERILAELDAVQAEQQAAEQRGWFAPVAGRIKAFGRGAMLMVPAVAAAGLLFVIANKAGWISADVGLDGAHVDGGLATSMPLRAKPNSQAKAESAAEVGPSEPEPATDPSLPSGERLAENQGFAVQVAPPRSLPNDVALVSDSEAAPGSSAMVRYRDAAGALMVDRQRRAGVAELRGQRSSTLGHDYYLARDEQGRAQVEFRLGGVHHSLVLEGGEARIDAAISVDEPDFRSLLIVANALRQAHGG